MVTEQRARKIAEVAERRQQGVVVIEDVYDPHNAEAVFRSCDAFGFQRVCLVFEQEAPFDPRRIGKVSSASANKWLDFTTYRSTRACIEALHDEGFEVVAMVVDEGAEQLFAAELAEPKTAILLGNENRGLSDEAVALADRRLTIPMVGMVQSLNLSVTAALTLYELTRQRLERGFDAYLLPPDERSELRDAFAQR